jgi:hypothetical protein
MEYKKVTGWGVFHNEEFVIYVVYRTLCYRMKFVGHIICV